MIKWQRYFWNRQFTKSTYFCYGEGKHAIQFVCIHFTIFANNNIAILWSKYAENALGGKTCPYSSKYDFLCLFRYEIGCNSWNESNRQFGIHIASPKKESSCVLVYTYSNKHWTPAVFQVYQFFYRHDESIYRQQLDIERVDATLGNKLFYLPADRIYCCSL